MPATCFMLLVHVPRVGGRALALDCSRFSSKLDVMTKRTMRGLTGVWAGETLPVPEIVPDILPETLRLSSAASIRTDMLRSRALGVLLLLSRPSTQALAARRPGCHALSPCTVSSARDDSDKRRERETTREMTGMESG
jgi:hypothetical protein